MQLTPKKIKLAAGNDTLAIEWSDGHVSAYPYRYLRDKCPCASCTGAEGHKPAADSPFPMFGVKPLRPERAELVGRYALQIFWNDHHSTGIYSFPYLRECCPCANCSAQRLSENAAHNSS
ncbi:MAG: gamma-butyrobetaine hydroxylase-like domain-containing protein [Terriglobia bacterium]